MATTRPGAPREVHPTLLRTRTLGLAAALSACLVAGPALAADFYVDPVNGSSSGDGSAAAPWQSLQQVLDADLVSTQGWPSLPYVEGAQLEPKNPGAPVTAGDTIWLLPGNHGELEIVGHYNTGDITIAARDGQVEFSRVLVRASAHWVLDGLTVSTEFSAAPSNGTLVDIDSHGFQGPVRDIRVENSRMYTIADASGWSVADWDQLSANGISADGDHITIRDNVLTNVNFGISVTATNSLVAGNTVDGFAGDGLRGLGDHSVFEYNTIKNCYDVNDNHDDGFQSWSVGPDGVGSGEVTGVVLRGNTFLNYEDPNQPMRCTLQGIGMFDGTFVDWVIENNVVIVDHWHGISLLGARNVTVRNNTVLDVNDTTPGPPWIKIAPHKNGTEASACTVSDNLTTAVSNEGGGVSEQGNIVITDPASHFVDTPGHDLHLLPSSSAVDAAIATDAPSLDRDRIPRPQGGAADVGAYEWHDGSVVPVGGAGGAATGGAASGGAAAGGQSGGGAGASSGTGAGGPVGGSTSRGGSAGSSSSANTGSSDDGGCGCAVPPGHSRGQLGLLSLLGLLVLGRRRRGLGTVGWSLTDSEVPGNAPVVSVQPLRREPGSETRHQD